MAGWTSEFGADQKWFDQDDVDSLTSHAYVESWAADIDDWPDNFASTIASWVPGSIGKEEDIFRTGRCVDFTPAMASANGSGGPYEMKGFTTVYPATFTNPAFTPTSNILIANRDLAEVDFTLRYNVRANSGTRDVDIDSMKLGCVVKLLTWKGPDQDLIEDKSTTVFDEYEYDQAVSTIAAGAQNVILYDRGISTLKAFNVKKGTAFLPVFFVNFSVVTTQGTTGTPIILQYYYEGCTIKSVAKK